MDPLILSLHEHLGHDDHMLGVDSSVGDPELKFVFTGNFLKSHFNIFNEKTNYFNSLLDLVLVDSPLNKKLIIQRKGVLKRFKDLENYHLFGKCFRKVLILKVFSGHNIKNN